MITTRSWPTPRQGLQEVYNYSYGLVITTLDLQVAHQNNSRSLDLTCRLLRVDSEELEHGCRVPLKSP